MKLCLLYSSMVVAPKAHQKGTASKGYGFIYLFILSDEYICPPF